MKSVWYGLLRSLCWSISPALTILTYQAWGVLDAMTVGVVFGAIGSGLVLFVDLAAERDLEERR